MVVPNPAIATIPNVIFREQILLIQISPVPVGRGAFVGAPVAQQVKTIVSVDEGGDDWVKLLFADVPLINPGQLSAVDRLRRTSGL